MSFNLFIASAERQSASARRLTNAHLFLADCLKLLRGSWRSRRLRSLASEAVAWRELMAAGQASNEEFTAWLMKSADHVQVWLELTAFDEELAHALDAPAGPVVSRSFIPRRRAMLFWPLAAICGKLRRHRGWWRWSATAKMTVVAIVSVIYFTPSRTQQPMGEASTMVIYDGALQNIAEAREYDRATDRAIAAEYLLSARYECRVRSRTIAALSAHSLPEPPDILQITSVTPFIPPEAFAGRYGHEVTRRISRLAEDSSKAAALVLREATIAGTRQSAHTPASGQRVKIRSPYEWELQTWRASTDALCGYLELLAEQDDARK